MKNDQICKDAENVNPIQKKNQLIELHKMMKCEGKDIKKSCCNYLKVFKEKHQYNEEINRKYFKEPNRVMQVKNLKPKMKVNWKGLIAV